MNAEAELPFDHQVVVVGVLLQPVIQFDSFHRHCQPHKAKSFGRCSNGTAGEWVHSTNFGTGTGFSRFVGPRG